MESPLPSLSESCLGEADNSTICAKAGAKGKSRKP